jgi:hypothetical protein
MARNPDPQRVVSIYGEPSGSEEPAERKRLTKIRRLVGAALLALLLVVALIVLAPGPLKAFLPRPRPASLVPRPSSPATAPADSEPLPAVPVVWERLDLGAMAADVAQDLRSGRYYYDKRFPGNFGLAIGYWKQALARLSGADIESRIESRESRVAKPESAIDVSRFVGPSQVSAKPGGADCEAVRQLLAAAEQELAAQFRTDSGDAIVLLKQGKRDQAIILLERMRADFVDIAAPQYIWTSVMLSRRRR